MAQRRVQRLGITPTAEYGLAFQLATPAQAESMGYTDAWYADTGYPDTLALAAASAASTRSLRMGVAITSVYSRTAPTLAATAATLNQLLCGRFVLGLGSSSKPMVEGWHGQSFSRPVTRVKETTLALRQAFSGEKTDYEGDTVASKGYRQPATDVPIFLAGLRGRMLEAAAEYGDGVALNLWPNRALEKIVKHIGVGAERAGKGIADREVINRYQICITDDPAAARDKFRASFGAYFATGVYNNFLAWAGFEEEARQILEGFKARDRAAVGRAFSDELVNELALIGPAEYVVERLRDCGERGVDTHIFSTFAGYSREEYSQVVQDLAECWHR